jgi:hypothetical protein
VEGDILDAARLGLLEIVLAGIGAIGGDLPRRHAATGDLALEHRQEALGIGGVADLDDDIEDQAAVAGDQVELVSVLHVVGTVDGDVGRRLERVYQFLAGRHRLTIKDAPMALGEDALDQRQIVAELGAPALGCGPGEVGQLFAGLLQCHLGGAGGGDELTIEPAAGGLSLPRLYSIARARFLARRQRSRATGVPPLPATPQLAARAAS